MNKNEIIQIQGIEYKEMTKQLLNKCALATLIPSKVSLIGIKPNLVAPVPAEFGGTTHPEVVAGIIEYLQEMDLLTFKSWKALGWEIRRRNRLRSVDTVCFRNSTAFRLSMRRRKKHAGAVW